MLGADEADDATQDVFIRAWQRLGQFRGDSAFGTWLFRLAVNVMLSRREVVAIRHKRHVDDTDLIETLSSTDSSPEMGLDFQAAIERLPPGMRPDLRAARHRGVQARRDRLDAGDRAGDLEIAAHRVRMILRKFLDA
jgi:RNA polymerase sigma-70 factor (ECF subfamily)